MFTSHAKFLAIEKHFKDPHYSIWKSDPLPAPNKRSSRLGRMRNFFYNLHKNVPEREHFGLIVANFVRCGGEFDPQELTKQETIAHTKWKKRNQSLIYTFSNELSLLNESHLLKQSSLHSDVFVESEIVAMTTNGMLSPETLSILESYFDIVVDEDLKLLCRKYAELLRVEETKTKTRLRNLFVEKFPSLEESFC